MEMELPGKRKRGRPKRFMDAVRELEVMENDAMEVEEMNPLWRPLTGFRRKTKKKKMKSQTEL